MLMYEANEGGGFDDNDPMGLVALIIGFIVLPILFLLLAQ